mmetsp:Transcript_16618/g.38177  ORF Transcript_16618/g.38177 Transcript_16618/m.38177 type:complete len:240 (+) Transcript_16618:292-1011(+)
MLCLSAFQSFFEEGLCETPRNDGSGRRCFLLVFLVTRLSHPNLRPASIRNAGGKSHGHAARRLSRYSRERPRLLHLPFRSRAHRSDRRSSPRRQELRKRHPSGTHDGWHLLLPGPIRYQVSHVLRQGATEHPHPLEREGGAQGHFRGRQNDAAPRWHIDLRTRPAIGQHHPAPSRTPGDERQPGYARAGNLCRPSEAGHPVPGRRHSFFSPAHGGYDQNRGGNNIQQHRRIEPRCNEST